MGQNCPQFIVVENVKEALCYKKIAAVAMEPHDSSSDKISARTRPENNLSDLELLILTKLFYERSAHT
jgi:hypothetical protein